MTPTHALIWPYKATSSCPETFVFTLSNGAREKSQSCPLGALVTASVFPAEPGLVVVMPTTGKITYWDSITSAAALDLTRQQRRGVEGSVGSMLSGEHISHIVNAEPAGFILCFSTGRLAQLVLRDNQGKPTVRVQMLRNSANPSGGLFGSLRSVFVAGGWRRDVVAVTAATSRRRKEERDVVVATAKGLLQLWKVQRGGQHTLHQEYNGTEDMLVAIRTAAPELETQDADTFNVLDLAHVPRVGKSDDSRNGEQTDTMFVVLAAFTGQDSSSYVLFDITLADDRLFVGLVYRIRSYTKPWVRSQPRRPRLLLPRPSQTAFIVFDKAVVVASVTDDSDSPDDQLLRDLHRLPNAFEDVIHFKDALENDFVGCGAEDGSETGDGSAQDTARPVRKQNPACLILLRGGDVLRIGTQAPKGKASRDNSTNVPIKSKIEQAICYGADPGNVIDFGCRLEGQYSQGEVERAVLEVSSEILNSTSKAVLTVTPSMEHQLKQRFDAIGQLATYSKKVLPSLSRLTRWKLLWDAEKLATACTLWITHDKILKQKQVGKRDSLLAQLIDMLHERYKDVPAPERGELDQVRHWFTKDVGTIQNILPWLYHTVDLFTNRFKKDYEGLVQLVLEANMLAQVAFETAFRFRQDNASAYDLGDENMSNGVLESEESFKGLPAFWTSFDMIPEMMIKLTDYSYEFAAKHLRNLPSDGPFYNQLMKIAELNTDLVDHSCRVQIEQYRWHLAQPDRKSKSYGESLKNEYLTVREQQFRNLAALGFANESFILSAMRLCERYHDMDVLVDLVGGQLTKMALFLTRPGLSDDMIARAKKKLSTIQARFDSYFDKFGKDWAVALYTSQINRACLGTLMDADGSWKSYLTEYLRANPAYAKLSWINDVTNEMDFRTAGRTLLDLGTVKEHDLWSQKVELSIARLSLLAATKNGGMTSEDEELEGGAKGELELVSVQEKLYQHVLPTIQAAIDDNAEIQLLKAEFGSQVAKDRPALSSVLEQGLESLVARQTMSISMLVDVLTLIDHHYDLNNPSHLAGQEFYFALKVADMMTGESPGRVKLLERIIWRRCMIRDDWIVINDTQLKDDQAMEQSTAESALFTTLKAGYKYGRATSS